MMRRARSFPHGANLLRRLGADEGGAVLVEFTLVAALLLSLSFGIVQYGLTFFVYNNMQDAAREAARRLSISAVTVEQARAIARSRLVSWPKSWNIVVEDAVAPSTDVRVVITLPGSEAGVLDFVPVPAQLRAEVVMPKEDF